MQRNVNSYNGNKCVDILIKDKDYNRALKIILNNKGEVKKEYKGSQSHGWSAVGDIMLEVEELDNALYAYKKALVLDKFNKNSYLGVSNCYLEQGNPKRAIPYLKRCLKLFNCPICSFLLGNSYFDLGDYTTAIYFYKMVDKDNTLFTDAQNNIEQSSKYSYFLKYKKKNEFDKALTFLLRSETEIYSIFDDDANNVWYQVGNIFYLQEKMKKALFYFKKSLYFYSSDIMALFSIGYCYSEIGELKSSIPYFKRAIKLGYGNAAIYNLGNVYFDLDDYDKAIRCYKEVTISDLDIYELAGKNIKKA